MQQLTTLPFSKTKNNDFSSYDHSNGSYEDPNGHAYDEQNNYNGWSDSNGYSYNEYKYYNRYNDPNGYSYNDCNDLNACSYNDYNHFNGYNDLNFQRSQIL